MVAISVGMFFYRFDITMTKNTTDAKVREQRRSKKVLMIRLTDLDHEQIWTTGSRVMRAMGAIHPSLYNNILSYIPMRLLSRDTLTGLQEDITRGSCGLEVNYSPILPQMDTV